MRWLPCVKVTCMTNNCRMFSLYTFQDALVCRIKETNAKKKIKNCRGLVSTFYRAKNNLEWMQSIATQNICASKSVLSWKTEGFWAVWCIKKVGRGTDCWVQGALESEKCSLASSRNDKSPWLEIITKIIQLRNRAQIFQYVWISIGTNNQGTCQIHQICLS